MSAKLVELIETVSLRGTGSDADVYRNVTQWWTKDGDLVSEKDEWKLEENAQRLNELAGLHTILDEQLGKEREPVGLRTRVLAAVVGCKKWMEHEARHAAEEIDREFKESEREAKTRHNICTKPGCYNVRQLYGNGNYSKLCREHNEANSKRQRAAREKSKRRPKK